MKRFAGLASAVALVLVASACAETDAGVTTKVKAQLAADEMVKAYKVDVDTQEHVVTLRGEVDTVAAKEQAVRIARNTEGVRDVVDDLRVVGTSGTIDPSGHGSRRSQARGDKIDDKADSLGDDIKDGARATGNAIGRSPKPRRGRRSYGRRCEEGGRGDPRRCDRRRQGFRQRRKVVDRQRAGPAPLSLPPGNSALHHATPVRRASRAIRSKRLHRSNRRRQFK